MLGEHISPHLPRCDLLKSHLLLLDHPVSHKVVARQDLLGPGVVDRVVEDVQGRLAVDTDVDGSCGLLSHHLLLELAKEARLGCGRSQLHVLTFAGAEAGIGDELGLPADGTSCRDEDESPAASTSVWTGEEARITVAPQLGRLAPSVNDSLPTCALQVPKDMLNPLPVSLS